MMTVTLSSLWRLPEDGGESRWGMILRRLGMKSYLILFSSSIFETNERLVQYCISMAFGQ
jgi:hypothetical protein